jgi:hypothetical protein
MVTRKPVSRSTDSNLTANLYSPPYPVTPIATNVSPNFRMQDVHNELRSATEYEPDSANAWSGEGLDEQIDGSSQSKRTRQNNIPDSLRVGPPGYTPRSSQDMLRPSATTTNPYLKTQQDAQSERSASAWGGFPERPAPSANTPPPPPLSKGIVNHVLQNFDYVHPLLTYNRYPTSNPTIFQSRRLGTK